jgi:hypothetical protein
VAAVVLNVTVTQPKSPGYVVLSADGVSRPATSNVNFVAGETVANAVFVPVGADRAVDINNISNGTIQVVTDVSGWLSSN